MNKVELLAPAGNFEKLKTAIHYGADAVYLGKSAFSLRAMTKSFETDDELKEAITYAHQNNVKAYVTVNIFAHNRDIKDIANHLEFLKEIKPDAIIVSDPGVFLLAKKIAPLIPIHISTQANITNIEAVHFWEKLGASRVNLARELSFKEIQYIREKTSLEIEVFVHGAVCISYSGRCYISAFLTGRSGNHGECTNSCRFKYALMEEKRPGVFFPVIEDDRGTYLMNSKDLCLIEYLPDLIKIGVNSFKIEGRMKGVNYVAGVVHTYRKAIDTYYQKGNYDTATYKKALMAFSSRGYTTGMFLGYEQRDGYNLEGRQDLMTHEVVGVIREVKNGLAVVELKRRLDINSEVYFLSPSVEDFPYKITFMQTLDGENIEFAKGGSYVLINVPDTAREMDIIRIQKSREN